MSLNLVTKLGIFIANILVGLWLVPYLIRNLGVAGYGLIPLATQLTSYIGLLSIGINGAISRYLTINIQAGEIDKAKKTFNSAFFSITVLSIVLIPCTLIFSYYVPSIFEVNLNLYNDTRLLFALILGMFVIGAWGTIFTVSPYSLNRLDLLNGIELVNVSIRIALLVSLFTMMTPRLYHVGIAYFSSAIIALFLSTLLWRKLTPQLVIRFADFNRKELKNLTATSGWLIINQIGTLLFLNIDLIAANKLFGVTAGGRYAAVLQWSVLLRSMAAMLSEVITPVILTYFAKNERDRMINLSKFAVKIMSIGMALPIGIICGVSYPLLTIWLGIDYRELAPLMIIMVSHLIINLSVLPLFSINIAYNKVRIPGWMSLIMGLGNVILVVLFSKNGWGLYGIALSGAIMLTLKNTFFIPLYTSSILNISRLTYIRAMSPGFCSAVLICLISFSISNFFSISNWVDLIFSSALIGIAYTIFIWFVILSREERRMIYSLIPIKPFRNNGEMV
ncbi:MAG: oligosaccharide flippase family protein [Spirochaetes bacterium]|nr:oligosaccharide flippase family protein [Spirochaetota bacterium]